MSEHAKAHAEGRGRLVNFVTGLSEEQWTTTTQGCPEWDVRTVVSHVVGIGADMTSGRFPAGDIDAWVQEAVDARKGASGTELVRELEEIGPAIDTLLTTMPPMMGDLLIGDVVTHLQDIRGALGVPGDREGAAVDLALDGYLRAIGGRISGAGLPALRIRHDNGEQVVGEGEPAATVTASSFELLRALAGRRTHEQIAAFEWDGDPTPYLPIFSSYGFPDVPITE